MSFIQRNTLTIFNYVCDIQDLAGEDAVINLELPTKPRHLQDENRRHPLQLNVGRMKGLLKQFLNCGEGKGRIPLNKDLVEMGGLAG